MTQYRIVPLPDGVDIEVSGVGDRQQALLAAFEECRSERCSCPTNEYEKLADMDLEPTADAVAIRLRARPGQELDPDQIAACLDYTVSRFESGSD